MVKLEGVFTRDDERKKGGNVKTNNEENEIGRSQRRYSIWTKAKMTNKIMKLAEIVRRSPSSMFSSMFSSMIDHRKNKTKSIQNE